MRAPLIIPNEAREGSRTKDSWGVNCFLEREDADRAVKRPGLVNTVDVVGAGTVGQGLFIWPELNGPKIVMIWDDQLFVLEYTGAALGVDFAWDVGAASPAAGVVLSAPYSLTFYNPQVNIGDQVDGYYATVNNPPTTPGPGDPYWSATPPSADRYRAHLSYGGVGSGAGYNVTVANGSPGPFQGQKYTGEAATVAAAFELFKTLMTAEDNFIIYDVSSASAQDQFRPYPAMDTFRVQPSAPYSEISRIIYSTDRRSYGADPAVDWTSSWNTADVANIGGYGAYAGGWAIVGVIRKKLILTGKTVYRVGTELRINYSQFSALSYPPYVILRMLTLLKISGCNQPEYNGTWDFIAHYPLGVYSPDYLYVDIGTSSPATPATGTPVIEYFGG